MTDIAKFRYYAALADDMLLDATHDEMTEALKILALNLAAYKARFGEIPQAEVLETLRSEEIGEGMAARLTESMLQLIGVMRTVMAVDQTDPPN
jgi:hypothetical protein